MHRRTIVSLTPAVLLAAAGAAIAQCEGQRVTASSPATNDYNGIAVAMDGNYVLTGAPGRTVNGIVDAGEVFAFTPTGGAWNQVTHFTSPTPATGDYFGAALAMAGGQYAIVGARGYVGDSGKAFIFKRDLNTGVWSSVANLGPGAPGSALGSSVAMNFQATIAVAGAPVATITDGFGSTFAEGQVLVYTKTGNTWNAPVDLHQTNGPIRHSNDGYGYAVACDGSTVVVGAINGGDAAHDYAGYIHIWTQGANNTWTNTGEIYAPDPAYNASFGGAVALSGGILAVGARDAAYQGLTSAGCVYIYRYTGGAWTYQTTLHAPDSTAYGRFGWAVSAYGDTIAVASYTDAQKVYLFRRTSGNQWVQDAEYRSPGVAADHFSYSVALSSSGLAIGADEYAAGASTRAGCAYIYGLPTVGSDSCAGAMPILQGSVSGCTTNCTVDGASTCGGINNGPDTWFSYTAPASGQVTIDTLGSTLDTILSVHSGCPGTAANTIACNDDFAAPQRWSKVTFNVTQGQNYLVRIAGYANSTGDFTLNVGPVTPACYANCDGSTTPPILNVNDFTCFLNKYAANDPSANCDGSTAAPVLNVNDFICFQTKYAQGCP